MVPPEGLATNLTHHPINYIWETALWPDNFILSNVQRTTPRAIDQLVYNASSGADVLLVFLISMIYCLLSLLKTKA